MSKADWLLDLFMRLHQLSRNLLQTEVRGEEGDMKHSLSECEPLLLWHMASMERLQSHCVQNVLIQTSVMSCICRVTKKERKINY